MSGTSEKTHGGGGRPDGEPSQTTADTIRRFVEEEVLFRRAAALTDDTPLVDGLIDSLGMARLISFLEEAFDIAIDQQDMVPSNFRTIRDIGRLVETKRSS